MKRFTLSLSRSGARSKRSSSALARSKPGHGLGFDEGWLMAVKNFYRGGQLAAVRHGLHRHLSAIPTRSERADRGHGGCHRRLGERGVCPIHRVLSEVGAATIRAAHAVHLIADLQIEYSLISRSLERAILPTLRELGIGVTAYGVL